MKNKELFNNNKGGFSGVVIALVIMCVGALLYIILDVILRGGAAGEGMFYIAENNFNISEAGSPAYTAVKNTWMWAPVMLMVVGVVYGLVSTQREEYYRQPR